MRRLSSAGLMLVSGWLALCNPLAIADDHEDHFEAKIRPLLIGSCFRCHGNTKTSGALRVDSRDALLTGGESGPAIVPGKPEESLLIQAIQRQADVSAMPPDKEKALRPDQIADVVAWVKSGAVWPAKSAKFVAAQHWSFEPIHDSIPPEVVDRGWGKTSVDAFIRAQQEAANVHPALIADKHMLIRRATFDLTGLPPTPEEVEAFQDDISSHAFETVVERLLNSPAYGEKWGRHWLDVVRYADTAGETADYPVPLAWRYRNYVIDAFNSDKPYNEFVQEQVAGDILASQGPPERYAERVTATGYLAISRRFGFDSENYHHLTIQDTIDTLGQSVLGISLGCARCHDHKFDAVSMQDYYGLYGIFDSSRYAFPGSEQKQKVRSMTPLLPLSESQPKWRQYEQRVAALTANLIRKNRPVPGAILRSVNDMDGDFELQAPAAGGSNGVLVPPWLYEGKIAVTTEAQSPYQNHFSLGRVGASLSSDAGKYHIVQAIHPRRSRDTTDVLHVNLDFRVAAPDAEITGSHRLALRAIDGTPAVELVITPESLSLRNGESIDRLGSLPPHQWINLQFTLDLKSRLVSGQFGIPGAITEFSNKPLSAGWSGFLDQVVLDSDTSTEAKRPTIEFDNLGIQESPIAPCSTVSPASEVASNESDPVALETQLQALAGIDGDFELQTKDLPPATPWGPGPNSVVKLSTDSQSPYCNLCPPGKVGIHMPNRGEYDGFGQTLVNVKPNAEGQVFVSFDFRCANQDAGAAGSWRYYLGHGPGNSAAVELFLNGSEFFRRSGDARDPVDPLVIGQWYQVQLKLDLRGKSYTGVLSSTGGQTEFGGQFATGWDGSIDYSFIDSYGHINGVRPALDADNFVLSDQVLPLFDAPPKEDAERETRQTQLAELRRQLTILQANTERESQELSSLLANGPFDLTYGMAEGTPHRVRIQQRGEPDQPGEEVPRSFVKALGGESLSPETAGSGRLELAQWITSPGNPLTARVMVNRIWQYHFGRGLVKTPNDFGVRGLPPTHPELLDHLALQFVRSGWSVKSMHRLIMLSSTYQQSSIAVAAPATAIDTADLYVRFPRRRLSAEEIRDSILSVSGELDSTAAREHPFPSPISWGFSQHGPFNAVYDHKKRSVYLMTQRLKRHPFLALFDGADPNASTADRLGTTVPTQALFFLNDPMIHTKSENWAIRLQVVSPTDSGRVEQAYRHAFGRLPTETERAEASDFLLAYRTELALSNIDSADQRVLAAYLRTLFGSNEFLYVD